MDSQKTLSETVSEHLADTGRSRSWLARETQIPLTTLDRKLRGDGSDFTLAQIHAVATVLDLALLELVDAAS